METYPKNNFRVSVIEAYFWQYAIGAMPIRVVSKSVIEIVTAEQRS